MQRGCADGSISPSAAGGLFFAFGIVGVRVVAGMVFGVDAGMLSELAAGVVILAACLFQLRRRGAASWIRVASVDAPIRVSSDSTRT